MGATFFVYGSRCAVHGALCESYKIFFCKLVHGNENQNSFLYKLVHGTAKKLFFDANLLMGQ